MDSFPSPVQLFKKNAKKVTPQRLAIFEVLVAAGKPLTAQDLHKKVRKKVPAIALDTVYRNLELLTEQGYASQIRLQSKGTALFEYQGETHHHHAICRECEKIFCIDTCNLTKSLPKPEADPGFTIEKHVFEVYGICSNCQR